MAINEWSFDEQGYLWNRSKRIKFEQLIKNGENGITRIDDTPIPIVIEHATDALRLAGIPASEYVTIDNISAIIPKVDAPTVDIATSINENETVTGTITDYNSVNTYIITCNKGTVSNVDENGVFTYTAPDITDDTDTTDVLDIYATAPGYVRSDSTVKNLTINYLAIIADQALSNNMLRNNAYLEKGLINDGSDIISIEEDAVYVENKTEQDTGENDWVLASDNTVKYTPKKLTTNNNVVISGGTFDGKYQVDVKENLTKVPGDKLVNVKGDGSIVDITILSNVKYDNKAFEINSFQSSDVEESDYFGGSVALSSNGLVALVGARAEDTTANNAGKVYTYKRDSIYDDWTEVNMFQSSDIEENDSFGVSVALSDDGLVALVGAEGEDTTATGAGKVYTYKRDTIDDNWTEVNSFQSSDIEEGDYFGVSVALSSDGLVALVGARHEDTTASNAGKVYTYKRDTVDDDWIEVIMFQSSDVEESDNFGVSVALSSDGLVALVGAHGKDTTVTNTGKVYTYKRDTIDDDWTEINMLQSNDVEASDYFGRSVALSGDGLVALVGSHFEDTTASNAGKVYIYKRDTVNDDWTEIIMFQSSDIIADDYFGGSVAISGDGLVALVGAYGKDTPANNAGKVYTFKLQYEHNTIVYNENTNIQNLYDGDVFLGINLSNNIPMDSLGQDINLTLDSTYSSDGTSIQVTEKVNEDDVLNVDNVINKVTAVNLVTEDIDASRYAGTVEIPKISATTTEYVGKDVTRKVIVDVNDIVVLDNTERKVSSTNKELTIGNVTEINMFQSSDVQESDLFGWSVALSGSGLVALVGALYEDTTASNAGKVYTYKRDTIDDNWVEVNMFQSSDIAADDHFGSSVALSGDGLVALVSAVYEDTTASNAGKVYTYKRDTIDDDWIEVNMFQSSDIEADDLFGISVALSGDGLVALVGAISEDTTATNAGKVYTYKRDTIDDDWTEVNMFQSSDIEESDNFGYSVALSSDGLVALASAFGEDTTASNAGKVYTYKRDTIDNDWIEVNMFQSSDIEADDHFGVSTALSGDGLVALVGAYYEDTTASNAGKVYVYKRDTIDDNWTEVNMFQSSDVEADDHFGISVALSSDGLMALVGARYEDTTASNAGKVYTYKLDVYNKLTLGFEALSTEPNNLYLNDRFPRILDITNHGLTESPNFAFKVNETNAIVKSSTTTNASVTVYNKDKLLAPNSKILLDNSNVVDVIDVTNISSEINYTIAEEINMFQSSDVEAGDYFGASVAISGDGLVALVGARFEDTTASNAGKVYTYKRDTIDDNWTEVNMFQSSDIEENDNFGISVAISGNGLVALVGAHAEDTTATDAGKVYTYKRDTIDDDWTEVNMFQSSDIEENDNFGISVALSSNGLVALVGSYIEDTTATNAGKVYTYKRDTIDDNWTEVNMFQSSDIEEGDNFGISVAISGNGLVALVGAHGEDTTASNAGKVYTYKRDTIDDNWTEVNMFQSSDIEEGDNFGISVAISGNGLVALVGAYYEDTTANNAGKVYTYKRATIDDDWTEINMFQSSDIEAGDRFGRSVAISSDGLVGIVGAREEDTTASNAGKVYTYKFNNDYTYDITFAEQSTAPTDITVLDNTHRLNLTSISYNSNIFTKTFEDYEATGRFINRKVSLTDEETKVIAPITTQLSTN